MNLKGRAKKLYREKRYEEFFGLMSSGADDDVTAFLELCRQDDELLKWYVGFQSKMWDRIFGDPGLEAATRAFFEARGLGDMFEFQRSLHTVGFATVEEIAKFLGTTVEDIEETVAQNPELFRDESIKVTVQ